MTDKHTTDPLTDPLIDEKSASTFLGYTPRFLQARRIRGDGPLFIKLGERAVRYRVSDLVKWIESHKRSITSKDK